MRGTVVRWRRHRHICLYCSAAMPRDEGLVERSLVMDGVSRVRQQPLGLLARSGLLPQRLPCGIQLLKPRAAVTLNECHGHVAIAHKMTPLM